MTYQLNPDGTILDLAEHPVVIDRATLERRAERGDLAALRVLEQLWLREADREARRCHSGCCVGWACEGCR